MYRVVDVESLPESEYRVWTEVILVTDKFGCCFAHGILYSRIEKNRSTRLIICEVPTGQAKMIRKRYERMSEFEKNVVEKLKAEENDDYSDDSLFNISSWGADLSFREIISMYEENELLKPELQRKYVWDKAEASRFIESILMGLPVPSVFFAQAGSQKLIVDGYQRIMTVYDYVRGVFSADNKIFRLSNSERINERWRNKAFSELSVDDQRKIRSTTIHAIIFEQKKPENDDTSLFQIFERINTSGRTLTSQEIRNCVYQGTFNSLMFELNEHEKWRTLFGLKTVDSRMRDIECILRFFVMMSDEIQNSKAKQISLKKALNEYMGANANLEEEGINGFREAFINTINSVYDKLGENAFRNYSNGKFTKKFHPAIFDAVSVAFYQAVIDGVKIENVTPEMHIRLLENPDFKEAISVRTTDIDNIKKRVNLAYRFLIEGDTNEA